MANLNQINIGGNTYDIQAKSLTEEGKADVLSSMLEGSSYPNINNREEILVINRSTDENGKEISRRYSLQSVRNFTANRGDVGFVPGYNPNTAGGGAVLVGYESSKQIGWTPIESAIPEFSKENKGVVPKLPGSNIYLLMSTKSGNTPTWTTKAAFEKLFTPDFSQVGFVPKTVNNIGNYLLTSTGGEANWVNESFYFSDVYNAINGRLPLAGGTLTGGLTGSTVYFSADAKTEGAVVKGYVRNVSGNTIASFSGNSKIVATQFTQSSDRRLKSEIKPLVFNGVVEPKRYIMNGVNQFGFIAQEMRELYPELVSGKETEDTYLELNYAGYTAVLQAQNIEQQKEIDSLKERVSRLEELIAKMNK